MYFDDEAQPANTTTSSAAAIVKNNRTMHPRFDALPRLAVLFGTSA